jgi:chromosome segregation protein
MRLTRLRISGFKSFVEPSDFMIEPGLTGVVGPNGCGKSNLVEALRWVMGESSYKNMRASGMDDVIFAGSGNRPARNMAEVMLTIDNSARTAPTAFNDAELIEVTRRIERDEGSTYRINGREVRARDVQLLFADAATGARSSALVRQGQIGELISAKPQARRRILEDAAGIAGLHSRRHEAELRLKAAEDNLLRLEDVLREIEGQVEALRRQSKQAVRYRALAADIRKAEALIAIIGHALASAHLAASERALENDVRAVADATLKQSETIRLQAIAANDIEPLRMKEAAAAAGLQRLLAARDTLDAEEKRAADRLKELEKRTVEIERDLARETALIGDARTTLETLSSESESLQTAEGEAFALGQSASSAAVASESELAGAEDALAALQAEVADANARRSAAERTLREENERAARVKTDAARIARDLATLDAADGGPEQTIRCKQQVEWLEAAMSSAEAQSAHARSELAAARETEAAARAPVASADTQLQRLETEIRTLAKLFAPTAGDLWPPVLDAIRVDAGYEAALGAALGEDLDASSHESAPVHWAHNGDGSQDSALPAGTKSLLSVTNAPPALARRLAQIGIVPRADGARLRPQLKTGQRLVSREGDVWRWDGFTAAAEAPSPAARRLAERNRLAGLEQDAQSARSASELAHAMLKLAQEKVRASAQVETQSLEAFAAARRAVDTARHALVQAERQMAEASSRRSALVSASERAFVDLGDAEQRIAVALDARDSLAARPDLETDLMAARMSVAERRTLATQARTKVQTLARESELRAARIKAIEADTNAWRARAERTGAVVSDLGTRLEAARTERAALDDAPDQFIQRRRALMNAIKEAENLRQAEADTLVAAQTLLADADRAARAALEKLSTVRETRAGAEARCEAAKLRLEELTRSIIDTLGNNPGELRQQFDLSVDMELPDPGPLEAKLSSLRNERERLGAVNLLAEDELTEVESKRDALITERDDLTEAIRRLRQAIGSLNREGRDRLLAAFTQVDAHFEALFSKLFGGGTAQLSLIDSDDPLDAGLEIVARPPGKKPQTMTLLSGGEQALTAIALIFAVFLTNPSPICVLDEVDAPLDDANVERYCDLLADMARQTQTRFAVITHNPITMARMDRLFGVTMAERGVSTLVSVDLQTAAAMREAG